MSLESSIAEIETLPLISVSDGIRLLQEHSDDNIVFIDGSWFWEDPNRNGRKEYERGPRIAHARYLDIDDVATKSGLNPNSFPRMMPTPAVFAAAMDAMEIRNNHVLIVYATKGCMFVHRAWWQIKAMGHKHVYLLDGNLEDWQSAGGPMEYHQTRAIYVDDLQQEQPTRYQCHISTNVVANKEDILRMLKKNQHDNDAVTIIDTRPPDWFKGLIEEPGVRHGRIPGAMNISFLDLFNQDYRLKSPKELQEILHKAGVNEQHDDNPIVLYCGQGITVCSLEAALEICGRPFEKTLIYDASWAEWGTDPDTPIVRDTDESK